MFRSIRNRSLVVAGLALTLTFPISASANHSWGSYHWARTVNPIALQMGDNLTNTWDPFLVTSRNDWNQSAVLNTSIVAGGTTGRKCRATTGRVEVCNAAYGNNGWLGLAQIWASGNHITKAAVKVNDTYFNTAAYNTSAWRNMVMCQEVGHVFGLDHQDENFNNANLVTCMDYTNNPESNQQPNTHDYDQLALIYAHLDSTSTVGASAPSGPGKGKGAGAAASGWGRLVATTNGGRGAFYELDLGNGQRVITHVTWAR